MIVYFSIIWSLFTILCSLTFASNMPSGFLVSDEILSTQEVMLEQGSELGNSEESGNDIKV